MRNHISQTPAEDAGKYIHAKLLEHADTSILFLVSGGSSFSILSHIPDDALGPHITIALTDERFTSDIQGNNFKLLSQTQFYTSACEKNVHFINSEILPGESHETFTQRIESALMSYQQNNPRGYTIGIFGIGDDGHTAGIFPLAETEFSFVYETGALYVHAVHPTQTYPNRSTVTPLFIEEMVDDIILFAVGSNKCDNILNYMHTKSFTRYQIPALIPAEHPQSILFTDCMTIE